MNARKPSKIAVGLITSDISMSPRADGLDYGLANEYAELLKAGVELPPLDLFRDDANTILISKGFHRYAAHVIAGKPHVFAWIHQGDRRAAMLFNRGDNADHGKRRSNADKRHTAETLLKDPEWSRWSNREIARRCCVDDKSVERWRRELTAEFRSDNDTRTYRDKHGNESQMNTENIGSTAGSAGGPPASGTDLLTETFAAFRAMLAYVPAAERERLQTLLHRCTTQLKLPLEAP